MDLATREANAAFADLICADPQWLREEFDALISASFSQPPAAAPPAPPQVPAAAQAARPPGRGRLGSPGSRRPPPAPRQATPPALTPGITAAGPGNRGARPRNIRPPG